MQRFCISSAEFHQCAALLALSYWLHNLWFHLFLFVVASVRKRLKLACSTLALKANEIIHCIGFKVRVSWLGSAGSIKWLPASLMNLPPDLRNGTEFHIFLSSIDCHQIYEGTCKFLPMRIFKLFSILVQLVVLDVQFEKINFQGKKAIYL